MFIDRSFNVVYGNSMQIRLLCHITKLPQFPEMPFAVPLELFKVMDGYKLLDCAQRQMCLFLYLYEKAKDFFKTRLVENKHHTASAHTIYIFIEKKNWCFHAIITTATLPYCKTA